MKRIAKNNGRAAASSARAANSIMMAPNPIPQLSPETLSRYIDGWERGYLREPSLLFKAIETRDDRVLSVSEKRYKSISRYGYDVVISEGHEDEARAEQHADAIRFCLDNLTATNAIKRDERGGFRTLVRQQCEAVGFSWSVHDIAWQPSREGITATFMHMPLYWFEHTTGQLRFLETDFQLYGRDLEPGAWMVTCGRGIHVATAIAYLFKRMSMMDWVIYCGRVGPGIHAKTSAQKDSPDWKSLEEAVGNFGIDLKMVTADGVTINPIEMALKGTLPWPEMVKLMNMSIDVLWRGGNLSSEAGKDQSGVMIQGEEKDTLEQDDAEMCSDAINEYIVGPLIEQQFAEQPLAWVSVKTGAKPDQAGMLQVDGFLAQQGFPFTAQDMARRYERELPEDGEEILRPLGSTQPAPINPSQRPAPFANETPDSALSPDAVRLIGDQVDLAAAALDSEARKILAGNREKMLAEMEAAPTVEAGLQILQDYINRIAGLVGEADLGKVDKAMETAMSIAIQDGARTLEEKETA
jgi:phage gp29-like protein